MRKSLNLDELSEVNLRRSKESFPQCCTWTEADWMTALVGEVGELANLLKKVKRGDRIEIKKIADELADTLAYLDLLASKLHVNLSDAFASKFNEVSDRVSSNIKINTNISASDSRANARQMNVNDYIWFKPTDEAKRLFREHWYPFEKWNLATPKLEIDEFGYAKMPLWEFMQIFGEHFRMAGPQLVQNNLVELAVAN